MRFANYLRFHQRNLLQNQIRTTLCITCGSPALILTVLLPEMPQKWMIVSESRFFRIRIHFDCLSDQFSQIPPEEIASKSNPDDFMYHLWIPCPHNDRRATGNASKMDGCLRKSFFSASEATSIVSMANFLSFHQRFLLQNQTRAALCITCGCPALILTGERPEMPRKLMVVSESLFLNNI